MKSSSIFPSASSSELSNKIVPSFKRKIQNVTKEITTDTKPTSALISTNQTVPVFTAASKKPKTSSFNFKDKGKAPATSKVKNVLKSSEKLNSKTPCLKTPDLNTSSIKIPDTISSIATPSLKTKRQFSDTNIRMAPSKKLKTPMDQYSPEVTSSTSINQSNSNKFACVTKQSIPSSQGLSLANEILQKITSSQHIDQSQDSNRNQQV